MSREQSRKRKVDEGLEVLRHVLIPRSANSGDQSNQPANVNQAGTARFPENPL